MNGFNPARMITHNGMTRSIEKWSAITGLKAVTIRKRLDAGWTVELALTLPAKRRVRQKCLIE
jgi:hypothetical protein